MTDFTALPSQILLKLPFVKLTKSPCKKGDFFVKNSLLTNARRCGIIDRPTLGAAVGFSVLSSDINFFVQNAYKQMFGMSSHNGHLCADRARVRRSVFPPYTALYGFFLLNLATPYARPFSRKSRPHMRPTSLNVAPYATKYVKFFFVKLTKYIFKKI
jgi:hypothetical protein